MVKPMTKDTFIGEIFDFQTSQTWNYAGELPAIVDFYSDTCPPCKVLAPILEELSEEYRGRVNFYKLNTDVHGELVEAFGIQANPSLLFIPLGQSPRLSVGARPKPVLVKAIQDVLGVK